MSDRTPLDRGEDRMTHPVHVGYLVVGLVFLGIAAIWVLRAAGILHDGTVGALVPAVLVAAGAIGLVAFATKERTRRHRDADTDAELD